MKGPIEIPEYRTKPMEVSDLTNTERRMRQPEWLEAYNHANHIMDGISFLGGLAGKAQPGLTKETWLARYKLTEDELEKVLTIGLMVLKKKRVRR